MEAKEETQSIDVIKESNLQKEASVEVLDVNAKEVETIEITEKTVEEVKVEAEKEESKEVGSDSVKKAYQSLIMPKIFTAMRETVTFKPITPSPPKSPQKVRKKLRSPPPPPREPSPEMELPSSPREHHLFPLQKNSQLEPRSLS